MSFTYKPKKRKRAKTHGFLVRSKSSTGRRVLKRRRTKSIMNLKLPMKNLPN
jgi:large subunit ribosomal protein L34